MTNFLTFKSLLEFGEEQLQDHYISNYKKEAEWLLLHIIDHNLSWLLVNHNLEPSKENINQFLDCIQKRTNHSPIQLIMGKATYYGRDFSISPGVFIPRPETELIIDVLKKKVFLTF